VNLIKCYKMRILVILLATMFLDGSCRATATEQESRSLSNEFMSIEFFSPQEGGGLRSVKNQSGFEFINRHQDKSLWQIELKRIPDTEAQKDSIFRLNLDPEVNDGVARRSDSWTKSDMVLINSDAVSATCKTEKNEDVLTMAWQGIDVGTEKAVLDVSVTVTLSEGDKFARFRAGFNNRSKKFTVFYFTAPVFNGIYPPDGKCDLDWLASPVYNGRLMRNPVQNGILDKPYRFQPNRGGHSMQFDAYYHGDNGLYLGCFDGMQNLKRYYLAANLWKGLSWGMVHVPDNMKKVPQVWSTPYDTVLRVFKGDWYDACQIYREWALKQSWAAEGPLYQRTSTAKWFKEIETWMLWGPTLRPVTAPYDQKITTALEGISKGFALRYWGKGSFNSSKMAPERFPLNEQDMRTFKLAKEHNYRIMGHIQGIGWDRETSSFKKLGGEEHTVRNFYGQQVVWDLYRKEGPEKHHICAIAYPGKLWTELLGDTVEQMAKSGWFDAVYLDSFNHAGTYMNFNPLYSDQSGGGNAYIKGNQAMVRQIKERARKFNPDFCFTAESFWEGNIAVLDGFFSCNSTTRPLKKGEIFAIPMVQVVYQGYTILYGVWASRYDLEEDGGLSYRAKFAQAFIWGIKSGWVQPLLLSGNKNRYIALEVVERRCKAYAAARKFLVYGQMLREPRLKNEVPELDMKWYRGWSKNYYNTSMPAVLRSMWRAPDGNLGVVLYNISSEEQRISLVLDDPGYGIVEASGVRITSLYPVRSPAGEWKSLDKQAIVLNLTVPARSPMVFELELKK